MEQKDYLEIACAQVLQKETSVLSVQWTVLPADAAGTLTPADLLERYFLHIRRFTLGLVRPVRSEEGVDFRWLGTRWALLRFQPPLFRRTEEGESVTLAICGGFLVQPDCCGRGELTFGCETVPGGVRVLLELSDFCPLLLGGPEPRRWRKWLYRFTQAAIHRLVTVRFLVRLQREMAGRRICCRVVQIPGIEGENI